MLGYDFQRLLFAIEWHHAECCTVTLTFIFKVKRFFVMRLLIKKIYSGSRDVIGRFASTRPACRGAVKLFLSLRPEGVDLRQRSRLVLCCVAPWTEAVHDSRVIMLHRPIKRCLISLSPSSETFAPCSDSFINPTKTIRYYAVPFNSFFQYIIIRVRQSKLCLRV